MKQVLQNLKSGVTAVFEVPPPSNIPGSLIVKSKFSLVSLGTERMLVNFGKSNILEKARSQPDKVKMVLDKVKTDGLKITMDAVRDKLDQPVSLGYCNVGVVVDSSNTQYSVGERVVSNGNHAELVRVPKNLCAKIPDGVDDESATFTVLGAIALQGIRLAKPSIGETFVVTGLGLIGLLTVQILRANGCRVLGIDFDSDKCKLAKQFGAETVDLSLGENPIARAQQFSRGRGVDSVLITANTESNDPVHQAAHMCRKRGRIVLVGVVGLELSRADFYEKELSFQVSCSYGPGRYDPSYEDKGQDYPFGFVRWTEQRNFEAILDLMESGKLNVKPLIRHRFAIANATEAYKLLDDPSAMGILLKYSDDTKTTESVVQLKDAQQYTKQDVVCGFLGAGNYASRVLIPAFSKAGAKLDTLVTSGGVSAIHTGKKAGFVSATTDESQVYDNPNINISIIATPHNLHSRQVVASLKAGKNVFVEKPLALNEAELDEISDAYLISGSLRLMVGFNRRFAPHIVRIKQLISVVREPKSIIMTMNAGAIPADHWTQDQHIGGGRIIGEACHYIDLMRFLTGSKITSYTAKMLGQTPGIEITEDKASITLSFEDGSIGTIHYFANGGKAFPKERIEVFCNDAVLQLDNFKVLRSFGWNGKNNKWSLRQDKGQTKCIEKFVASIRDGMEAPIPFEEILEVSRVSVRISELLRHRNI